jgi:hypothetical protein
MSRSAAEQGASERRRRNDALMAERELIELEKRGEGWKPLWGGSRLPFRNRQDVKDAIRKVSMYYSPDQLALRQEIVKKAKLFEIEYAVPDDWPEAPSRADWRPIGGSVYEQAV